MAESSRTSEPGAGARRTSCVAQIGRIGEVLDRSPTITLGPAAVELLALRGSYPRPHEPDTDLLAWLDAQTGTTAKDLAACMGVERLNAQRRLTAMHTAGLVRRSAPGNRHSPVLWYCGRGRGGIYMPSESRQDEISQGPNRSSLVLLLGGLFFFLFCGPAESRLRAGHEDGNRGDGHPWVCVLLGWPRPPLTSILFGLNRRRRQASRCPFQMPSQSRTLHRGLLRHAGSRAAVLPAGALGLRPGCRMVHPLPRVPLGFFFVIFMGSFQVSQKCRDHDSRVDAECGPSRAR